VPHCLGGRAAGLLNRVSLFRVKVEPGRCNSCGRCDRACYVAQLAPGNSLFAEGKTNASTNYSCSRCLSCVSACPTGALGVGLAGATILSPAAAARRERRPDQRTE
jgi:NAD-dependent dihydropyrimidine dehydrogenase PreA subunit